MDQHYGETNGTHIPHDSGLSVGSMGDAAKVRQLEEEVRELADRANGASQKFADYENEIRVLEAKLRQEQRRNNAAAETANESGEGKAQVATPGISRFGSFMHSRKASPLAPTGTMSSPREKELEATLVKEQTGRIAAEQKVKEVNAEIEELSESLFQQANEMVATERKQNATLQERLEALEKEKVETNTSAQGDAALLRENTWLKERLKVLEQRDGDRSRRLEKLEAAHKRIERVRSMLAPG
ncbi:hypothetical protein KC367_g2481 [Hortaea werneckii]|uniref:GDP/GTP exchange factor Sec2 N-terminal domain-containing protein n=2 Tax=Hortaea werneckii TaxID=91943 RepID=A0A3M7I3V6_HORWE|nr:hypothetical protein KC358_g13311 [Hortaea werneckii]OTA33024.1 hypothetical protein BTJ68_06980 [Hortaea werneckii EXF-2000]KAI6809622.1 hypothetical protein KC350_g12858 [Hortaea werneckii]KAI6910380.1 hypothetical protein KC348_g13232 [Hortaea werneckii]KAI6923637.1 hypothetical protein KC341_g14596 [Hortaea werneckii]